MILCPKCSSAMGHPVYDPEEDKLRYTCRCGYEKTALPHDKVLTPSGKSSDVTWPRWWKA